MYSTDSFCQYIWGLSYEAVQKIAQQKEYRLFSIPKKGGSRVLCTLPSTSGLFRLQRCLLERLLTKQHLPTCVKGFVRGESYHSFLAPHASGHFFLRIDLQDFFGSIKAHHAADAFDSILTGADPSDRAEINALLQEIVLLDGTLPQGACTSPAVSNLVFRFLDQRILKYCQVLKITYTRYADDLLFSSASFDFSARKWFLRKLNYILSSQKFTLNYTKIKYGTGEISLNGFVVAGSIRLSRRRLSDIRRVLSFVTCHIGLYKAGNKAAFLQQINTLPLLHRDLTRYPFSTLSRFTQYLCGYRAYLLSWVNPNRPDDICQKELKKLVRKIEKTVLALSS